jgi:hypothetical protein
MGVKDSWAEERRNGRERRGREAEEEIEELKEKVKENQCPNEAVIETSSF